MDDNLSGMQVAVLATDGVEQSELVEPRKALERLGARVSLIAPEEGTIQGFDHDEKADTFPVDQTLAGADPDRFDALVLPGGVFNSDALRTEAAAKSFVRAIDEAGKPLAVICHGAWLLVSAGLVAGRTMTSHPAIADDLCNADADWVDQEVVVDGSWVSSRTPDDLPAFNREMVSLFAELRGRVIA